MYSSRSERRSAEIPLRAFGRNHTVLRLSGTKEMRGQSASMRFIYIWYYSPKRPKRQPNLEKITRDRRIGARRTRHNRTVNQSGRKISHGEMDHLPSVRPALRGYRRALRPVSRSGALSNLPDQREGARPAAGLGASDQPFSLHLIYIETY